MLRYLERFPIKSDHSNDKNSLKITEIKPFAGLARRRTYLAAAAAIAFAISGGHAVAQDGDVAKYCKSDIQRLCKNVKPGNGRILGCLKSHKKEMTVGCAQALQKYKK